jgi:hypothetical protein
MSFKLLIFSLLLLHAISLHLNHEPTTANNSTPCVSPGSFNASTGKCDCLNGSIADPNASICVCSKEKPYLSGNQCIACDLPSYFNTTSHTCIECQVGTVYNQTTKICEKI